MTHDSRGSERFIPLSELPVLNDLSEIRQKLGEVYLPEGVEIWLNSPNRTLEGQRPTDLIRAGRTEEVRTAVGRLT